MITVYTEILLDHFLNPRNVGVIEDADGVGTIGDPGCGDYVKIYIKVDGDVIRDAKFQIYGCPSAIATTSVFVEAIIGKRLEEALAISEEAVVEAVGGLPEVKIHCSNLAVAAFQQAVIDFLVKKVESEGKPTTDLL